MKIKGFLLTVLLGCSIILIFVGYMFDRQSKPDTVPSTSDRVPHIEISMDEGDVCLVGGVVEEWTKWEISAADLYNQYRRHGRIYTARSVGIQWGVFDIPDGSFIRKQYFELSTEKSFQNAERYDMRSGERSIELNHLLVDTEYYFRITLELENSQECTGEGTFKTKWSPRIIEFENLRNMRDIGGWKTVDGKTVRQGMVYRGCELDGATYEKYQITDAAVDIMLDDLNIKTELDLRPANLEGAQDMLGEEVEHRYFALPSYAGCFTDDGNHKLRQVFAALATEESYPVYLHCTNGTDRTGIVCYLLEALLGMSEADCYREWELSVLENGNGSRKAMDRFVAYLREMDGDTLQKKVENYLLSIGVTQAEIENIRNILAE